MRWISRVVVALLLTCLAVLLLLISCVQGGSGAPSTPLGVVAASRPGHPPSPAIITTTATAPSATPVDTQTRDFTARVIVRTNAYRIANGCPALKVSTILMGTGQAHSEDMALHDFVGHQSSDGTKPFDRIKAAGYMYRLAAENVAWGFAAAPEAVVNAWFDESPPDDLHRRNILNCALREIGVGYYYLADDPGQITAHAYWTEDFGTPLP